MDPASAILEAADGLPVANVTTSPLYWRRAALLALAYMVAGLIGLRFATVHEVVSPVWPAAGVAIAALLRFGTSLAPAVAVGGFFTNFLSGASAPVALSNGFANMLETLAVVWLVRRWVGPSLTGRRLREIPGLVAAVGTGCTVAAAVGATTLWIAGSAPAGQWPALWFTWWVGDVVGALVVLPALVHWWDGAGVRSPSRATEMVALNVVLLGVAFAVFLTPPSSMPVSIPYVLFPPVTWAAWRFGPRGAAHTSALVVAIATVATASDLGPFAAGEWSVNVLALQLFVFVLTTTALVVGAATAEQEDAARALATSDARQAALLRALPDMTFRVAPDGRILDGAGQVGRWAAERWIGRSVHDLLPPDVADRIMARIAISLADRSLQAIDYEAPLEGERRFYEARIVPGAEGEAVAIVRDVTDRTRADAERRQLERQVLEGQKLESLGILAGGVAHDFNNLLTGILGHACLARETLEPDAPPAQALDQIEQSARHAADLCRQLLAYAGKGRLVVEPADLSTLVNDLVELLLLSVRRSARLRLDLADGLPLAAVDPTQIRQVLINLVMNASEALPLDGGEIVVRTGLRRWPERGSGGERVVVVPAAPGPGDYVCLEVADTGSGIAPETLPRIFEPFYTTKFTGRGLGLAAVAGIAGRHGGALVARSQPGQGTVFTLLLPVAAATASVPQAATRESDEAWRGQGVVLVADDDNTVRTVVARMLRQLGFETIEAGDGDEAIEVVKRAPHLVAVCLDLVMPRMPGLETVAELRRLNPGVPVVLMSGYAERDRFDLGEAVDFPFLAKPFDLAALRATMRVAMSST